jgi:hypothetical protein
MLLQWKDFARLGLNLQRLGAFRRDLRTTAPSNPITPVTGRRSIIQLYVSLAWTARETMSVAASS